jgi:IS30 family transposase
MDQAKLQSILDALPPKKLRSRLEAFRQLILELRDRDRSYREIARVLAEQCQVQVAPSTIHDFVRVRAQNKFKKPAGFDKAKRKIEVGPAIVDSQPPEQAEKIESKINQRIAALKQRKTLEPIREPLFTYEEDEPLKLTKRSDKPDRT